MNPGRSGSAYLQHLLVSAEGVVGEHEHLPTMTGEHLFAVEQQERSASIASRRVKAEAVASALAMAPDAVAYADTSNMFIKTFADVIVEAFEPSRLRVLHLRRDTIAVAKSFRELGCYTERNVVSRPWMFDPLAPTSLAATYCRVDAANPTEMIVGYLVETELKAARFRSENPEVLVHDVWLEQLQAEPDVLSMLGTLGLSPTAETSSIIGERHNTKVQPKTEAATTAEPDFADRVVDVLQRFVAAGAPVAALLPN